MDTNSIKKSNILHDQWWNYYYYKIIQTWKKKTRQGDPISTYLIILVLETAFIFIKENKNIKGINIFDNIFLYSAYADDTTFFLSAEDSVIEVINAFHKFSLVSGLKPNEAKCEIAGIGVLKEVSLTLYGMNCIDLIKTTIKISEIHFSYNKKLEKKKTLSDMFGKYKKYWRYGKCEILLWKQKLLFSKL